MGPLHRLTAKNARAIGETIHAARMNDDYRPGAPHAAPPHTSPMVNAG